MEKGDYTVPGVPGTGAQITLNMADTAGGATDRLLPTGNPIDRLTIPGFGQIEASTRGYRQCPCVHSRQGCRPDWN